MTKMPQLHITGHFPSQSIPLITVQSYDVRKYIIAWWSYAVICTLHYLITIIMQTYLKVLNC